MLRISAPQNFSRVQETSEGRILQSSDRILNRHMDNRLETMG
ncbi:hypothetical protein [Tolypothrix sp. PCC 7910]|nr:hypothetical protein [Tolypothrix sp. PCC 7910]